MSSHPHPFLESLRSRIVEAGRQRTETVWTLPPRVLPVHDLLAVLAGTLRVRLNGRQRHCFGAGSWILLPAGIEHAFEAGADTPLEIAVVHFRLESPQADLRLRHLPEPTRLPLPKARQSFALGLFDHLIETGIPGPQANPTSAARTLDLLLTLLLEDRADDAFADRRIAAAVALIHARASEKWTARSLGAEVGLSPDHFRECFRREVGRTPARYLRETRLQLACRLLRQSDLSVQEIADATGWENASTFTRTFRQSIGQTPGAFRRTFLL